MLARASPKTTCAWPVTRPKAECSVTKIPLMRATLASKVTLPSLWNSEELTGLFSHSAAHLAVGLLVFAWGYRTARQKGTLAHY